MRVYGPWAIRRVREQRSYRWRGLTLTVPTGVFHPGLFFSSGVLATEIEKRRPVGLTVLDVGCGSGLLSLVAARAGASVTAVDINPEAVRATAANASANELGCRSLAVRPLRLVGRAEVRSGGRQPAVLRQGSR